MADTMRFVARLKLTEEQVEALHWIEGFLGTIAAHWVVEPKRQLGHIIKMIKPEGGMLSGETWKTLVEQEDLVAQYDRLLATNVYDARAMAYHLARFAEARAYAVINARMEEMVARVKELNESGPPLRYDDLLEEIAGRRVIHLVWPGEEG